ISSAAASTASCNVMSPEPGGAVSPSGPGVGHSDQRGRRNVFIRYEGRGRGVGVISVNLHVDSVSVFPSRIDLIFGKRVVVKLAFDYLIPFAGRFQFRQGRWLRLASWARRDRIKDEFKGFRDPDLYRDGVLRG